MNMSPRLFPTEEKESIAFFSKYCRAHLSPNSL
jgi:hypothetical protein